MPRCHLSSSHVAVSHTHLLGHHQSMAGQGVRGPVVLPGQINPRPVPNHRAAIEKIGARLTRFGVPAACFEEAATLALGYTDAMVLKNLRPFERVEEDSRIEALLSIGRDEHFYPNVDKAELPKFLLFLDFLRTPAGQKCIGQVSQVHRHQYLRRRGKGRLTAEEIAWLEMFDIQRSDYLNHAAEVRRHDEAIIADLELQLRNAKAAATSREGGALHTAAADGPPSGSV
ncbi:hypothetical protein ACP275_14G022200 [Erythranthe tilingii]